MPLGKGNHSHVCGLTSGFRRFTKALKQKIKHETGNLQNGFTSR